MDWRNERVLVTGGAGVIGRELVRLLAAKGSQLLVLDRVGLQDLPPNVRFHYCDLSSDDLGRIREQRPSVVFHLAASFERTEESTEFWEPNYRDNIVASHRLLEALAESARPRCFVFASSYLVYDPTIYLSIGANGSGSRVTYLSEESPLRPRNLVGMAKLFTEYEGEFLASRKAIGRVVNARIFRVYGRGSRDVISRWVRAALRGQPLSVYREQNSFDFIYAGDVAEALIRLAEAEDANGAVNVGSGVSRSIADVLSILRTWFPIEIQPENVPGLFEMSCADIYRLRSLTGWVPPTRLEEGIRYIVEYEQTRLEA